MSRKKILERGVVYGVSGLPWLRETLISARSVRKIMPDLPLELHIDKATCDQLTTEIKLNEYFDYLVVNDSFAHWRGAKFSALFSRRYKNALYLDGDTFVTDRIDELFEILEKFDIAAMPAPQRVHPKSIAIGLYDVIPKVPDAFSEYNSGVMPFRCNQKLREFFSYWVSLFDLGREKKGYLMDQSAFRSALYHSDLRMHSLTPEYNLRAGVPNTVKGKVKIIHAHGDLEKMAQHINANPLGIRVVKTPQQFFAGMTPREAGIAPIKPARPQ